MVRANCTVILALLFVALACIGARAQANSSITGIITDQSGAVVPNATITVTDAATGIERTTVSTGTGLYEIAGLNPSSYIMKVSAPGFQTVEQKSIVVNVSSTLRVDLSLNVGAETQTVVVEANQLAVQSDSNVVTTLINEQQITELATNGRNVVALAALGLGVSANLPDMNIPTSVGSSFAISFNGLNQAHNIWLIDGGEAYDRGSGGKSSIMPSQDALTEFQVLASNYPPDYGISSGGTVSMAIKGGSQKFHGQLWEFVRNDALQAHNYFDNNNGQNKSKPKLRLNIFGFNGSGPVFIPHVYNEERKKTFFFYNQEWRKIIQGTSPNPQNAIPSVDLPVAGRDFLYTLPHFKPAAQTQIYVPIVGDPAFNSKLSAAGLAPGQPFPQNKIPASLLDANGILFANTGAVPLANTSGDQYSQSVPAPTNVREELFRIDHNINDKWLLMGHFIHDSVSQDYAVAMWGNNSYPTVGNTFANPSYSSVIKITGALQPNVLMEAAFNYNGNKIAINNTGIYKKPSGWTAGTYFSNQNANNRMPVINLNSWGTWYDASSWPWRNAAEDYAEVFAFSVTHDRHNMKFGGGYNRYTKNQQIFGRSQGQYQFADAVDANGLPTGGLSGDSYVDLLLGFATNYLQLQNQDLRHYVNNTISAYAMDNWHITPRLSIQYGIRYDGLPHAWERNNRISNFDPRHYQWALMPTIHPDGSLDPNGPGFQSVEGARFYMNGVTVAGQAGIPRGLVNNFYQTFQPRVGFSLDLTGNGKTVMRGGFGTFFERMQGNDIYNVAPSLPFSNTPASTSILFSNPSTNWITGGTAATPTFPQGMTTLQTYYPAPAVAQYSLGVQHELLPSLIWVTQFVGNMGWHQNVNIPVNTYSLNTSLDDRWHTAQSSNYAAAHGGQGPLTAGYTEGLANFPGFSGITQQSNQATSIYNGFQTGLRQQSKFGLSFEVDYTYSHQIDSQIQSNDLVQVSNPFNLKYDRGSGALDRRHMLNINYVYKLPIMHNSKGVTHSLLAGWEVAGTAIVESGLPWFGVGAPGGGYADTVGLGGAYTIRPNANGRPVYPKRKNSNGNYQWVSNSVFSAPTPAWLGGPNLGFGNAGRDIVVGPSRTNFSTSLYKAFEFGERASFEFRVESFNTFNHTQFNGMHNTANSANFGEVSGAYDPRTFEFGGKLIF
ncbi:MAG TPA: TonB-dependent receptor [Terracidiphilus sp.]|nr:TonB-dependent receptor [Terracidiphilus sp.]